MARIVTPLSDTKINKAKAENNPYKLFDGGGLYLLVKPNGVKNWRHKYKKPDGKETSISYGDYPTVSLKEARGRREQTKAQLAKNINPVEEKKKQKELQVLNTFLSIANSWIDQTSTTKQWAVTRIRDIKGIVNNYLKPNIGNKSIDDITAINMVNIIDSLVNDNKNHTAKTIRQLFIKIFNYAILKGLITENPAFALSSLVINSKTKHRAVIKLKDLPKLIEDIRNFDGNSVVKFALLININVFMRASELAYARWQEIDFINQTWTIPATRQQINDNPKTARGAKMKTPHIIPLSEQTITLLEELKPFTLDSGFVFTLNNKKPISYLTTGITLRRIGYGKDELTLHGFRTLACSALIESGLFSKDAIERQMSHIERNNARAAYIHNAEHLTERRKMMQWWSDYIDHILNNGYIEPYNFRNGQ